MRASESLNRYRASMAKLHENFISDHRQFSVCKPLYDWEENDVFRYFFEREIRYCPIYDAQSLRRLGIRLCHRQTDRHAEARGTGAPRL